MSQPWTSEVQPSPESDDPGGGHDKQQRWALMVVAAVVVLAAGAIGFFIGRGSTVDARADVLAAASEAAPQGLHLRTAFDSCSPRDIDNTLSIVDEDTSIVVDTRSEYRSPAGMDCVLSELDVPESILAQIGRTTSMMGVQDADHDGFHLSWSYHPDNGVNMVITDEGGS
jgi:hypothetical protein